MTDKQVTGSSPMSPNVEIVRKWYKTFDYLALMDPNAEWQLAEGFPHGGTYVGYEAIFKRFFPALLQDFEDLRAEPDEFLDTSDTVVALGHYHGRVKANGIEVVSPFAHVWRVSDGKIVGLRQYTDTLKFARALAGETSLSPV